MQHVVLQHLAQLFQRLAIVTKQRHHALVGLLAREAGLGVERDGALAFVTHINQRTQAGLLGNVTNDRRRGAQAKIGLNLGHGQFDRAIPKNLQNQRAIELDVGLHQGRRGHHFTQHVLHRLRVDPRGTA